MKKKIGVMIVALVVVIGGIFYAQYKVQIEAMSTEVLVEEIALPLSLLTEEDITTLVIEDTNNVTLEKQGQVWKNAEEPDLLYHNDLINEWVNYFQTEESINIIRNVEDLNIYGITETTPKITISSKSGKSQTFRLGSINTEQTIRYIYSDETELVYSVSPIKSEVLLVDSSKLIDQEIALPDLEQISTLTINQLGTELKLVKENDKWFLKDYFNDAYEVKTEVMVGLLDTLNKVEKESLLGKMTEEESYGMDTPNLIITIGEDYVLKLNSRTNGTYYLVENDRPYVYTVAKDAFKIFKEIKPIQMIRKQVYRPNFENVDKIIMTNPQNIYKLKLEEGKVVEEATQIEATSVEAMQQNDGATEEQEATQELLTEETEALEEVLSSNLVGTLNNKALDNVQTESLLNLIQESVCIETVLQNPEIEQKTERKAEISIVYYMKDGSEKLIELIPYDTNYYILRIDGNIEFAANKEKVTVLFSELGKMIK